MNDEYRKLNYNTEALKIIHDVFSYDMTGDLKYLFDHDYFECVEFLLNKYGAAKDDYFVDEYCSAKGKHSGTKDGLFCHHIYEFEYPLISRPEVARMHPFELQKKEYLCYCNILEHLILHIKIDDEYRDHDHTCGTTIICQNIAKYLNVNPTTLLPWEENCRSVVINDNKNLENLSNIIGYVFVSDYILNKEFCFDLTKILGSATYSISMIMFDLLGGSVGHWRYELPYYKMTEVCKKECYPVHFNYAHDKISDCSDKIWEVTEKLEDKGYIYRTNIYQIIAKNLPFNKIKAYRKGD